MLKATVSGSFHRYMPAIYDAVGELRALGVDVLSPSDPRVVDHLGEFLFVASDRLRSIKLVQDRHFEAIRASDLLWLVCPDGYVGASASAEIGAAHAYGTPIFSDHVPTDLTLQQYVRKAESIKSAVKLTRPRGTNHHDTLHYLIEPDHSIKSALDSLQQIQPILRGTSTKDPGETEHQVKHVLRRVASVLGLDSRTRI